MTLLTATNKALILDSFTKATIKAVTAIEPLHRDLVEGKTALTYKDSDIYLDGKELVLEADRLSDSILAQELNLVFPETPAVREEKESSHKINSDSFFTIDGLDGTICFAGQYPGAENMWGILLAYFENSQPELASIYLRNTKEIITLTREQIFIDGQKYQIPKACDQLTIAIDLGSWQNPNVGNIIVPKLREQGIKVLTDRTSEAGLADYVIRGMADAWISRVARIWDVAPFSVAMEAMGGVTRAIYQEDFLWNTAFPEPAIYARSPEIADKILEILKSLPEEHKF
jgi:fructose-1,6-bisphosphatase/inositol monophosphatase family enzyme